MKDCYELMKLKKQNVEEYYEEVSLHGYVAQSTAQVIIAMSDGEGEKTCK